jgi:hypothetical protein
VKITEKRKEKTKRNLPRPAHWAELCVQDGDHSRSKRKLGFPMVGLAFVGQTQIEACGRARYGQARVGVVIGPWPISGCREHRFFFFGFCDFYLGI